MAIKQIDIGGRLVGDELPFYTIAEVGSNFDGSLERARMLVDLAIESGADAVKFQTFGANQLVSEEGFKNQKVGYQAQWKDSVINVYKKAEFPREWHREIAEYSVEKGIAFFSSPYDFEGVDLLEELDVPAYKIGSGDLGYLKLIRYIAERGKPIIVAAGAATMPEVDSAIRVIKEAGNDKIVLLQCVTNYPASFENINVRVIEMFRKRYDVLVGYSDHTPGSVVAMATVALGGCMIEKHFTDDKSRPGPDHPFAMDGNDFRKMVDDVRLMEKVMGKPVKEVYPEEVDTAIIMKRGVRAREDLPAGTVITDKNVVALRPREVGSIEASEIEKIVGRRISTPVKKGESLYPNNIA